MLKLPTIEVINRVFQEFQVQPGAFIGHEYLPLNTTDFAANADTITWETFGPSLGMTNQHRPGTDPRFINFQPVSQKTIGTAFWKEGHRIGERDILMLRKLGTFGECAGRSLVTKGLENLDLRLKTRMEWLRWQALMGTLTLPAIGGAPARTIDYEVPNAHKVPADVAWTDTANADPIADLQAAVIRYRGKGAGKPDVIINAATAAVWAQNAKVRDLVKQSSSVVQIGTDNIGELMVALVGGIRRIRVYDEVYLDEAGNPQTFVPDYVAVLIGAGQGVVGPLGEFASTPSLHNGGIDGPMPGSFVIQDDNLSRANPYLDLFAGIYGLPVIYFPKRIQVIDGSDS